MHADALPPPHQREAGWGLPLALALLVHLLVALVFIVAWFWSPERNTDAAAGDPSVEASLALSASEASAAAVRLVTALVRRWPVGYRLSAAHSETAAAAAGRGSAI